MSAADYIVCDPKPLRFAQRFYLVEIVKGLAPGDQVVTAGLLRLSRESHDVRVLDGTRPAAGPPRSVSFSAREGGVSP